MDKKFLQRRIDKERQFLKRRIDKEKKIFTIGIERNQSWGFARCIYSFEKSKRQWSLITSVANKVQY
jgi:hypothetical protein